MDRYHKETPTHAIKEFIEENHQEYFHLLAMVNKALKGDFIFIAEITDSGTQAETCLLIADGRLADNINYPLKGSPCENVYADNSCLISDSVAKRYPDDLLLRDLRAESYIGLPIRCNQHVVALVAALSTNNSEAFAENQFVAEIFAAQLSAQLSNFWNMKALASNKKLLDEMSLMAKIGAWEYNFKEKKLFWSDEVYRIYGVKQDSELTLEFAISFYDNTDQNKINKLFHAALNNSQEYLADLRLIDAQGNRRWVRTNGKIEKDRLGQPIRVYGAIEDVTSEKELLNTEQEQSLYLKGILDNLNDAVVLINANGDIKSINIPAEKMFGYSEAELTGKRISILMPEPYASAHAGYMRNYHETGNAKIIGTGRQLPAKRKSGEVFQMELTLSEYKYSGSMYYIGIVRDITERIQANDTIFKLAFTDDITGLKNRITLKREVNELLARSAATEHYLYFAYLDVDGLSAHNLSHGNDFGDKIIAIISKRSASIIGDKFEIYKYSSDKFIIVSRIAQPPSLLHLFEHEKLELDLLDARLYVLSVKNENISPTISLTSMISQAKTLSFEFLIDALEFGMKRAKQQKPFGHFSMGPMAIEEYKRGKAIKKHMYNAAKRGEFYLVFQPQFSNRTTFSSSEALVRWSSDELGFISPAEFIPLAEESDDIIIIGDWVIDAVCKLLSRLNKKNIQTRIAVNISGKQIIKPDFEIKLHSVLKAHGVQPGSLILELTETALVTDINLVKQKMISLANDGFTFSIDDFGTGHSSLSYIKELPISELKIDKSFVDGIGKPEGLPSTKIVNVVIDMAKALNLKVIAEGVETETQYDYLINRGCDAIQGYLLSKPLNIEDWLELVKSGNN